MHDSVTEYKSATTNGTCRVNGMIEGMAGVSGLIFPAKWFIGPTPGAISSASALD